MDKYKRDFYFFWFRPVNSKSRRENRPPRGKRKKGPAEKEKKKSR
jgi:hypothetical protein